MLLKLPRTLLKSPNLRGPQMSYRLKSLMALPFLLLTLSGCWNGGTPSVSAQMVSLAAVPGDIRGCFKALTGRPMPGQMSKQQIVKLITDLRSSELRKSACGTRLLALYDSQSRYGR